MGTKSKVFTVVGTVAVIYFGLTRCVFNDDDPQPQPEINNAASVVKIVDGDTIDVEVDGETKRIRLLNIDTPEIGRDGDPSECLATDAKDYVASILPIGTEVDLEYDEVKQDRYGRDLAGVYKGDMLVNAEIARQGFAKSMVVDGNDRFLNEVQEAENAAKDNDEGVHGVGPECMILDEQARKDFQAAAQASEQQPPEEATEAASLEAQAFIDELPDVREKFDGTVDSAARSAFYGGLLGAAFDSKVGDIRKGLDAAEKAHRQVIDAVGLSGYSPDSASDPRPVPGADDHRGSDNPGYAPQPAPQSDSQPGPAPQPAPGQGSNPQPAPAPQPAPQPAPAPAPAPAAPSDNYTGCRAYGGNYALTNIDEKGQRYAKIDCTTKAQIG